MKVSQQEPVFQNHIILRFTRPCLWGLQTNGEISVRFGKLITSANIINFHGKIGCKAKLENHLMISKPWGCLDVQRDVITTWFPEPFHYKDVDRGWRNRKCTFPILTQQVSKEADLLGSHKHVQGNAARYLLSTSAWSTCKLVWKSKDKLCGASLTSPPSKSKDPQILTAVCLQSPFSCNPTSRPTTCANQVRGKSPVVK